MHLMLAWDIKTTEPRRSEINAALKQALKGYSWVRALGNVYIVKIESVDERDALGEKLKDVAKTFRDVNLIYSPAMQGGRYNGWLPKDLWPKIRQRAEDE